MPLAFPFWLRATHAFNILLLSLLARSGLEILSAHPKRSGNDHCRPGSEWLRFTRTQLPKDTLWTGRDERVLKHLGRGDDRTSALRMPASAPSPPVQRARR